MPPRPGGGGLVILPKKSWNVWNQDNKAKVAKDEAANAQLIEAKEKCRRQTLQQIRFERLNGDTITKEEEEQRIQHALDTMDINDYIEDQSMQEIAKNINDRLQREQEEGDSTSNRKKRKHRSMTLTEEEMKFKPRKRHKRNDVTMIEDHYSQKSKFQFDPVQYAGDSNTNRKYHDGDGHRGNRENHSNHLNHGERGHFSLFNERDLKNKHNRNGYANPDKMREERKKKEMEEYQFKLGRTEIESRKMKKPWYLMTHQKEKERRMLMKADEVQRSLPRRLKDYNRNTDELKEKSLKRKAVEDPLCLMNQYLNKSKKDSVNEEPRRERKKEKKIVTKEELKRQKKELLKQIKRDRKKTARKEKRKRSKSKSSKRKRSRH